MCTGVHAQMPVYVREFQERGCALHSEGAHCRSSVLPSRLSSSLPPGAFGRLSLSASFREWSRGGRVVEDESPAGAEEANSDPAGKGL